MPVNPSQPQSPQTFKALDLIVDAMIEIGMLSPGEQPDGDNAQWAFRKLNYLLDVLAAQRKYVWASTFQTFNLIAGHSPHTIGPNAADFLVNQRPMRIESWSLVLNTGQQAIDLPHRPLRDDSWWAGVGMKSLQSNIPTDLYYSADSPNGSLFFWPVPNVVYPVRLELWTLLSQFAAITDPVDGPGGTGFLPPAYRAALMLTLAETLQSGARKSGDQGLAAMALAARNVVFGNNAKSPQTSTTDSGMTAGRSRAEFNWETGNLT